MVIKNIASFQEFCYIMQEVTKDMDEETGYKESFRVFSKDEEGCIPPDEIKLGCILRRIIKIFSSIGLFSSTSLAASVTARSRT